MEILHTSSQKNRIFLNVPSYTLHNEKVYVFECIQIQRLFRCEVCIKVIILFFWLLVCNISIHWLTIFPIYFTFKLILCSCILLKCFWNVNIIVAFLFNMHSKTFVWYCYNFPFCAAYIESCEQSKQDFKAENEFWQLF